eukprot:1992669-Alexandrium_andersonii.AAC.1
MSHPSAASPSAVSPGKRKPGSSMAPTPPANAAGPSGGDPPPALGVPARGLRPTLFRRPCSGPWGSPP